MSIQNVMAARADLSEILNKIKEVSSKTTAFSVQAPTSTSTTNFSDALASVKSAFSNVNDAVVQGDQLKESYVLGDKNVSLSQVLVASQKSKLAFEGLITVRNKILEAYKEVMNMPV